MPSFPLIRHPATRCEAVRFFQVELLASGDELLLRYSLEGDIAALSLPKPSPPRRADRLWEHTCFEAFVKSRPEDSGYQEFNFAPSGAWAAYCFDAYREGMAAVEREQPTIVLLRGQRLLEVDVRVKLDALAADTADLRLGLAAVIEEQAGGLSYWACTHPTAKPDFHHPDSFVCPLRSPS